MALDDNYLQFANNPYLNLNQLSLADALAQQNQAPPTLPEIKTQEVYGKLQAKKEKLGLAPPPDQLSHNQEIWAGDSLGNSGLLDVAQSSLAQAGGVLMDAGKSTSNRLFETEFDDSMETGWSDRDAADALTGVSREVRKRGAAQQGKVGDAVAEGRYLDALLATPDAALYTAADSAGSLVEIAAGTLLTGGVGAVANIGHKLWKGKKALDKVSDGINAAKAATVLSQQAKKASTADKWLDHVKTAVKATPKAMAQTSLVTTDIVQRQADEFEKLHNRKANAVELSGMVITNALIMSVSPWMIKELYLPHPLRNIGKASKKTIDRAAAKGKIVSEKTLRDKFQNELSKVAEKMDKGAIRAIAEGVFESGKRVLAAGGAEAVQEYVQTWAGILGTSINTEKGDSIMDQALAQFMSEGKRDEALTSAYLGAGAGAATKGAIEIPGRVAATTVETTKGVTKTAGKFVANQTQKAGDKLISDKQHQQIQDEYRVAKGLHEALSLRNEDKTVEVQQAKSFDNITDPELKKEFVNAAGKDADLKDPDVFQAAADKLESRFKGEVIASKAGLEAHQGFRYIKEGAKTVVKTVAEEINITKEDVEKVLTATKALGESAVDELKTLNKSATRGVISLAMEAGNNQTRKGFKTLRTGLRQYTPAAMESVANAIASDMPKVAAEIRKTAHAKRVAEKTKGIHEDSLIGEKQLSDSVRIASNDSTFDAGDITLPASLMADAKGRWENSNTVDAVEKALKNHMSSDMYKLGKGLPETEAKRIQDKIDRVRKVFSKQPVEKAKKVGSKIVRKAEKYAIQAGKLAKSDLTAAIKKVDQWTDDFINGKPGKTEEKTVRDPQTKRSWVLKTDEKTEYILASLRGLMTAAREDGPDAVKKAYDGTIEALTSEEAITSLSNTFNTTDPNVIIAVIKNGIPALLLDDAAVKGIRSKIEKTLEGTEKRTGEKEVQRELNAEIGEDLENPGIQYVDENLTPEQQAIAEQVITMLGKGVCK